MKKSFEQKVTPVASIDKKAFWLVFATVAWGGVDAAGEIHSFFARLPTPSYRFSARGFYAKTSPKAQSNDWYRGPTELFMHFARFGARALLNIYLIWFGYITRLPRGGGDILLVQIISTCLTAPREGGEKSAPYGLRSIIVNCAL